MLTASSLDMMLFNGVPPRVRDLPGQARQVLHHSLSIALHPLFQRAKCGIISVCD